MYLTQCYLYTYLLVGRNLGEIKFSRQDWAFHSSIYVRKAALLSLIVDITETLLKKANPMDTLQTPRMTIE